MDEMTLGEVLTKLEYRGCAPKRTGNGQYQARCPAHDDRTASLSVAKGNKKPVIFKCHAGCSFQAIITALDLKPKSPTATPKSTPQVLPSGPDVQTWIYKTDSDKPVLAVVRRNPPRGGKTIWQMTPAADGQWVKGGMKGADKLPLLNVRRVIGAKRVMVVEGEKCVDAVQQHWPNEVVTTSAGGSSNWAKTDWSPCYGKSVLLVCDNDDAGREMMFGVAQLLAGHDGTTIKLIVPRGKGGADIADWIRSGEVGAVFQQRLETYDPDKHKPTKTNKAVGDTEITFDRGSEMLRTNQHYRILGILNSRIAIQISVGDIQTFTRSQIVSKSNLLAIAPRQFWTGILQNEQLPGYAVEELGCALLGIADSIGTIDPAEIYGRGPVVVKNELVWHLGDRLLIGGEEQPLAAAPGVWAAGRRVELTDSATPAERHAVRSAVMRYGWSDPQDGMRFLGWLVSSLVGGALPWRPHVLLTASASAGKSWILKQVAEPIHYQLGRRISNATSASIARLTQTESLPIIIDEAEATENWIQELLALVRVAAGGDGVRLRCDGETGYVTQAPRFSCLLSATTAANLRQADQSRFASVTLGDRVADWPSVRDAITSAMAGGVADRIRSAVIRETDAIVRSATEITDRLESAGGTTTRDAKIAGALTAGWRWWGGEGDVVMDATNEHRDAIDMLDTILSLKVRAQKGPANVVEGTLAELLVEGPTVRKRIRYSHGVMLNDDGTLIVAHTHRGLRHALRGTIYAEVDIGRLLHQLTPGRREWVRVSIASRTCVAVALDRTTLHQHGYEFGDTQITDDAPDEFDRRVADTDDTYDPDDDRMV